MKKHVKKLSALFLALAMLLVSAVPAMAEEIIYGPVDSWEHIGSDNHLTVKEESIWGIPAWTFENEIPSTDTFAYTFKDVVPGLYDFQIMAICKGLRVEVTIDGATYLLPQTSGDALEGFTFPVNVLTQRDVQLSLRFKGVGTAAVFALALIFNSAPVPEPSLQNPGFEDGLTGWTKQGAFEVTVENEPEFVHSGDNFAVCNFDAYTGFDNYISQNVPALGGSYTLEAYVLTMENSITGAGAMMTMEALDKDGKVLETIVSPAVSDTKDAWQKLSVTLNAPVETRSITVKIGGVYCIGAFGLDDVRLIHNA